MQQIKLIKTWLIMFLLFLTSDYIWVFSVIGPFPPCNLSFVYLHKSYFSFYINKNHLTIDKTSTDHNSNNNNKNYIKQ